ncbi:alcohol dehydrogenase [Naematelia encephala]|uniref:Alcohol dehydrogenase n=1 Tax=Naematelia encephala TaxID=71784 RepID=A0A1Y2APG0_9TREE|nr:alcohol dehydrogenase [Naematelia encephala]
MSTPKTQRQWILSGRGSVENLSIQSDVPVPTPGPYEVLINFKAASLNYGDLLCNSPHFPYPNPDPLIPLSDGAGVIVALGANCRRFKVGDRVMKAYFPTFLSGLANPIDKKTAPGLLGHGIAREYAVFTEESLVRIPDSLDWKQAAALPCAGVTAWSALFGLQGRRVMPGDWVLTQGTGGVSLFALQFAKAAGARVVATTSSDAKADILKSLGADHIINYRTDPAWATTARELTGGAGFQHIVDIGGPGTLKDSLNAIAYEGVLSVVGLVDLANQQGIPTLFDILERVCIVRATMVGSKADFEDMVKAIEANNIKPVLDDTVFAFDQLKEAYEHLKSQKHIGKIVIDFTK